MNEHAQALWIEKQMVRQISCVWCALVVVVDVQQERGLAHQLALPAQPKDFSVQRVFGILTESMDHEEAASARRCIQHLVRCASAQHVAGWRHSDGKSL